MMDMKAYIAEQLDAMGASLDRELLRGILEEAFLPLVEETHHKYEMLEKRVYDELPFSAANYGVSGTVLPKEKATAHSWQFPILDHDDGNPAPTLRNLQEDKDQAIATVFIEADYLTCLEIENSGAMFSGQFIAEGIHTQISVRLRPAKRYQAGINQLYKLFVSNCIPWATLNHPYLCKFFDIVCVQVGYTSQEHSDIPGEIKIDFKKYASMIKYGLVPVWNICRMEVIGEDFPMPAQDKVNYEYRFPLNLASATDGYLMEYGNDRISAMRREEDALIIASPFKSGVQWNMWRLIQKNPSLTEIFEYPVMNNRQHDSFAGRMVASMKPIKTKAELHRIIQSFSASEYLTLQDFYITKQRVRGETWEANSFITDEIRDIDAAKTLLLQFRPTKKGFFLNRDILSFLTSQVQLLFPEYHCAGVLV